MSDRDDPRDAGISDQEPLTAALRRALEAHPEQIAVLMDALRRKVVDEASLLDLMARVSNEAVRLIQDAEWAGVTARFDGSPFTMAHTAERVLVVDEGQYDEGDGPCLSAIRQGRRVAMVGDEVRVRWPQLADVAEAVGVRSYLAEPLHARDHTVGSLNLYSARPLGLRTPDPDIVTVLIEYLDRGLSDYSALDPAEGWALRLRQRIGDQYSRDLAIGILMARDGIDAVTAARRLGAEAQRRGIALQVVAAEYIAQRPAADEAAGPPAPDAD